MTTVAELLDALTGGDATLAETVDAFREYDWAPMAVIDEDAIEDPVPNPDSFAVVNEYSDLTPGQYQALAAAYQEATASTLDDEDAEIILTSAAHAGDIMRVLASDRNLRNYWTRGGGAAKIRWGTDGSFDRCVRHLRKYVARPQGLCAEYHKEATGEWPAEKGIESAVETPLVAHGSHNQKSHGNWARPNAAGGGRSSLASKTSKLASVFHENWRASRKQESGGFEPRVKSTKDKKWATKHGTDQVDIANTPFDELPSDWQAENLAAAKVVTGLDPNLTREQAGAAIHDAWLSRNDWAKGGDLDVPFAKLPKEEQDKDLEQYDAYQKMLGSKAKKTYGGDVITAAKSAKDEAWEGVLTVEGVESGDGRLFSLGSLDWAALPLPLMYQPANVGGHNASVHAGDITHAARRGNEIYGWGVVFGEALAGEHGPGIKRMLGSKDKPTSAGVSVDVDSVKDADVEYVYADGDEGGFMSKPETTIFHRGRIRGATLVAFPAFTEAKLSFTNEAFTASVDCGCEDGDEPQVLTAAGHTITIPDLPPASWFERPTDVKMHGQLTVTDEGRVFGRLGPANTTHRSVKRKVPMKTVDYTRWMGGETIVEGGKRVVTGVITANCGHAPTEYYGTLENRREHYDNSCSVVANVRIGEDSDGVWVAGALKHGVASEQVASMLGCRLSGDWQPHPDRPGVTEFIAALLVPVPGFAQARSMPSVQFADGMLVASSVPVVYGKPVYADTSALDALNTAKRIIAANLGLDPATRRRELAAELGLDG